MPESSAGHTITVAAGGSLNAALAGAVAGDVIQLHGGNYGSQLISGKNFSTNNPVTITNYPGETPIMVGRTSGTGAANAVTVGTSSGLRFRHLVFDAKWDTVGLKFDSPSSHDLEADSCVFRYIGSNLSTAGTGVLSYGYNLQVWNSTFHDWGLNAPASSYQHGIYMGAVQNMVIANNVIYDGANGYGIQAGPSVENSIITNNTIDHMTQTVGGAGAGIVVWSYGTPGTHDLLVVNNILTNNITYGVTSSGSGGTGNVIRNNLTYGNNLSAFNPGNMFTDRTPEYTGDPRYVNRPGKDFHLDPLSPALEKAEPTYTPRLDKDGNARPALPALGAYN